MFQSPCGEVIVKVAVENDLGLFNLNVSVPLRGSDRESYAQGQLEQCILQLFQSPCGEVIVKGASTNPH